MSGLISTLLGAKAATPLFGNDAGAVTAGAIRDRASRMALPPGSAPIFLHTASAANFCAGLLAAASERRTLALPAHTQTEYLAEIGAGAAFVDDRAIASGEARRDLDRASLDPLLVFFTSGSTGAPKRVQKNLSRLEHEAATLEALWGKEAGAVIATVSHQHIYGMLFRIVWPLLSGRASADNAALYWEDLKGKLAGATLVASPAHLSRLPPRPDLFESPPALVFSSGQLLAAADARACAAAFGKPVTEVLGSTETGGIAWRRQEQPGAAWTPMPGVALEADEVGALSVRSPHLQDNRPQATGDMVELLHDGRFLLRPRGDRVVKIDGKRVSLTRVEAALEALPEVSAAAALSLPERGGALATIVVPSDAGAERLRQQGAFRFSRGLRAALAAVLEPAERPKHWRFPAAIPESAEGKRVLSRLRALFAASPLDVLGAETRLLSEGEAELAFVLPPELIFFRGHFPTHAILPGVAQVHLATLAARRIWPDWRADGNVVRLKFRRVLMPDDRIVLKLRRLPSTGRVAFLFHFRDIVASEGEIGGVRS